MHDKKNCIGQTNKHGHWQQKGCTDEKKNYRIALIFGGKRERYLNVCGDFVHEHWLLTHTLCLRIENKATTHKKKISHKVEREEKKNELKLKYNGSSSMQPK